MNNLIKLKISPMNTDNSVLSDQKFEKQMNDLKIEKKQSEEKKTNFGKRVSEWLDLFIETFNFAYYARIHFQKCENISRKKRDTFYYWFKLYIKR